MGTQMEQEQEGGIPTATSKADTGARPTQGLAVGAAPFMSSKSQGVSAVCGVQGSGGVQARHLLGAEESQSPALAICTQSTWVVRREL